jgi:para-nitrobenzyl esterase
MDITVSHRTCALALWACTAAACGSDGKSDPTRIVVADGELQGAMVGTSLQFVGIPYAKPPIGDLRWKAPVKPDPWTTARDATQFGKRCAQLTNPTLMNAASNDEDCLYLNVWTPSPAPSNAPVMVWIHGGGNVNGSANEPVPFSMGMGLFYTGEFLAEQHGVIVVSLNYRLGLFGFFAHAELIGEEDHAGNQGLQDQQMALQWVHDNIAKFGGDPANVTVFGESAGSLDVCLHVASPASAGLFARAVSESGGCTTRQPTQPEAEAVATRFAADAGCTGAGQLACLRGKSAADLMAMPDADALPFAPDVDAWFMPDQPRALYDAGTINKVPYLLGSNTDEGTLFLPTTKPVTEQDYTGALGALFPSPPNPADTAAQVAGLYKLDDFASGMPSAATAALAGVIGDSRLVCTTLDTAERAAHAGAPVFMYNFDVPVPALISVAAGYYLGATHGSELTSVFGTSPTFSSDAAGKAVSDLMQRYWTNFAKTGDPNAGSDPKWPAFTAAANVRLNFALTPSVVTDFRAAKCQFWQAGYAAQFAR